MKRLLSLVQMRGKLGIFDDDLFSLEITKSEILRIRFLLIIFSVMALAAVLMNTVLLDTAEQIFQGRIEVSWFLYLFFGIAGYYLVALVVVSQLQKKGLPLPPGGRYFNAVLEGLIPTIAQWFLQPANDLPSALSMPPLLAYAFFITLSVLRLDFRICLTTGLVAGISYFFFAIYLLSGSSLTANDGFLFSPANHLVKAGFIIVSGVTAGFVAEQLKKRIAETFFQMQKKDEITEMFGEHVSPQVVSKLVEKGGDTVEEKEISVMFLDVRSFTSFSEHRQPAEVYAELNRMFSFMTEIIQKHGGMINKFLGDGFLAVFGAPLEIDNHARAAVDAAREIYQVMNEKRRQNQVADLSLGIGIHSGVALTGNVGGENRKEFTIIGDVVNLASRIESTNKKARSNILISEATKKFSGLGRIKSAGQFKVKGRKQPVRLFKLA